MNLQDITLLYDYNVWANKRILAASANLSHEQFTAPTNHSWGSLRGTLVHTLDTEYGWRNIMQHQIVTDDMTEDDLPTLDVIRSRWNEETAEMRAFLNRLRDEDVDSIVRYMTTTGQPRERVLWHMLFHVINHGMQHRSEAAVMLTDFGHSPGEIDYLDFLSER